MRVGLGFEGWCEFSQVEGKERGILGGRGKVSCMSRGAERGVCGRGPTKAEKAGMQGCAGWLLPCLSLLQRLVGQMLTVGDQPVDSPCPVWQRLPRAEAEGSPSPRV